MVVAEPRRSATGAAASEVRHWQEIPLWRDVTEAQWNDWKWQAAHVVKSLEEVRQILPLTPDEERGIVDCAKYFKFGIPPYYASLMDPNDPSCPVRLQAVPRVQETHFSGADQHDPLFEDVDSPVPHLTHRYPDRVLLLITDYCAMYCRFCTRRRFTAHSHGAMSTKDLEPAFEYLERTKEVRDVLLSGGDPLMVNDEYLEHILKRLREIDHIEIVRIGSRAPCTLPMRITPQLVSMLKRYHPLWLNTHFNHPKEITPEASTALAMLADAGIPLGNQTVLLRGINDCPTIMKHLVHKLVLNRVRPYYFYQCDLSEGIEHFRTRVSTGIEIAEALRGHTSGFAVPLFILDAPGGGGKVPLGPNYMISESDKKVVIRNYEGGIFSYPEPDIPPSACPDHCVHCQTDARASREGVAGILGGQRSSLVPEGSLREKRRREKKLEVTLRSPGP
ncbi:MAG TPA: lysine 2,3-aminomutase [Thermoplasmata archaeon]|nr:lysine 2,3-aminomutase [Thermoplasmata archaeon]